MSEKDDGLVLSKKHGVQPCIPLCPVCDEEKNEIVMLGAAGDELAKALGHADGAMPMHAHIPGDLEPCDKCKSRGITIYVADRGVAGKPDEVHKVLLVTEDYVKRLLQDSKELEAVLSRRVMGLPLEVAEPLGLMKEKEDLDE